MRREASSRSRRWAGQAQNLFGLLVLAGFGYYLWRHRGQFASLLEVSPQEVVLLAVLVAATWLASMAQSYLLYQGSDLKIGFWESIMIGLAAGFGNYLPGRVGTMVRAHYLKSRYGLRYARFVSLSGMRTVLMLIATGLSGLVATVAITLGGGPLSVQLLLLFLTFCVLPLVAWLWNPPARTDQPGRLRRILHDFGEGFAKLREKPSISVGVVLLILTQQATLAARFYVAERAMSGDGLVMLSMLMAPLAVLISFAAVTPGGLGIREALMGYATYATGASFEKGVFVGTVDRAVLLGMVAVFGGASFVVIWSRVRRTGERPATAAHDDAA